MKETISNIEFIRGIPYDLDTDDFFDVTKRNIIILDDMMSTTALDPKVSDLFSEGSHHRSLGVINLTQNLFPPGRNAVTQRRNTQYMIIFKSPMSQDQIRTLGTYICPGRLYEFLNVCNTATDRPHGYLVIDAKQDTLDAERFKTDIVNKTFTITPPGFPLDDVMFHCGDCNYVHDNEDVFDRHECENSTENDVNDHSFVCRYCQEVYTSQSSLASHKCPADINTHSVNFEPQSKPKQLTANMSETHECLKCGVLYSTPYAMVKHMSKCNTEMETESIASDDEILDDFEDDSAWKDLLQEVYDKNDERYQSLVTKYTEEGVQDPEKRASEDMRSTNKSELKAMLYRIMTYAEQLKNSVSYQKILSDFKYFVDEKHYSVPKAIKAAIRKNDDTFEEFLDSDDDDDDDSSESSESNDESDNESDDDDDKE